MIEIRKASRQKAKLRIGMSGPSGSGKTMSALLIAKGIMGGSLDKVVIIDTENRSADLYSHLGPYGVIPLEAPYTPERYIEAMDACEKAGIEVVIIDSASHEYEGKGGIHESNELLGQTKFKGNNWAAWSVTTPRHQKFLEAITTSKMHVITTVRTKTDTIMTEDKKVKKVGTKEIQREGFEYELTLNFNLDRDKHYAIASKDRTSLFSEVDPFIITEATGKTLKEWSDGGSDTKPVVMNQNIIDEENKKNAAQIELQKKQRIMHLLKDLGFAPTNAADVAAVVTMKATLPLETANYDEIISRLTLLVGEAKEAAKVGGLGVMPPR